ncbi:hypothetical protein Y600_5938 [Burkholderia pseudomallei MSHR3709]|nr:hypothetical protein Y600_5938 [Burkholderia pseudomallei MSHR3709]
MLTAISRNWQLLARLGDNVAINASISSKPKPSSSKSEMRDSGSDLCIVDERALFRAAQVLGLSLFGSQPRLVEADAQPETR